MPSTRRARGLMVLVAVPLLACSGGDSGAAWRSIGDSVHVLADDLPDGWVVSSATLRPGIPSDEWRYRADVYEDGDGTVVIVSASEFVPPEGAADLPPGAPPGDPVDVEPDEALYAAAYAGVGWDDEAAARQIGWRSEDISLTVTRIAAGPSDDELVRDLAGEIADVEDLDFGGSEVAADAGFTLAATLTELEHVEDYTITYTHESDAGATRGGASQAREGKPRLSVNVGARMYLPVVSREGALADDPDAAEVTSDGDSMTLEFTFEGMPVTVSGTGVPEEALRAFARSLREVSLDDWKDELGDRLLTDEPERR